MKKIFLAAVVTVALFSCKKNEKTEQTDTPAPTETVTVKQKGIEQVPPAEFEKKIAENKGQIIDVRTPKEYASGYINGAVNMHIYDNDFTTRLDSLDKNKTVYVYCKAGGRSAEAVETLEGKGFKHIVELEGGMDAWNEAGKPVKQ